jgi:hypothetical protein
MISFCPKGKKTHTKSRDTVAPTSMAPRDLPQYLISFEVSFQERAFGLFPKELVYRIECSVPLNKKHASVTLNRRIYAAKKIQKTKKNVRNEFINKLLQLVADIPLASCTSCLTHIKISAQR